MDAPHASSEKADRLSQTGLRKYSVVIVAQALCACPLGLAPTRWPMAGTAAAETSMVALGHTASGTSDSWELRNSLVIHGRGREDLHGRSRKDETRARLRRDARPQVDGLHAASCLSLSHHTE